MKKNIKKYVSLFLIAGLLEGQLHAFALPEVSFSYSWIKQKAQSTVQSLLKTRPINYIKNMIAAYRDEFYQDTTPPSYMGVVEKKENTSSENNLPIEVKESVKIKEVEQVPSTNKNNNNQDQYGEITISQNPSLIGENSTNKDQEIVPKSLIATMPLTFGRQETVQATCSNSDNPIKDILVAGAAGGATPTAMTSLQYITNNEVIAAQNIIPAIHISLVTALIQKLHGVKEGTQAIDAMIGNALVGTSLPMVPVAGAVAELSVIANEVITKKGGIEKLARDIDWTDVILGSTKESKKENAYNAALIKKVQTLTKNKESAQLLTTITLSALESTLVYSVLGILGIATGGTGLLAVAGSAAVYGAGKGAINYITCRAQRSGFAAKIAESIALKYALQIGGSLAAIDVLPIVIAELAVSIVQTGVDQMGGWDELKKEVGDTTAQVIEKRLALYERGISETLKSLEKMARNTIQQSMMYGEPDDDAFIAFLEGKEYVPEQNIVHPDETKTPEKKSEQKGWFARLFEDPNGSFNDDEYSQNESIDDSSQGIVEDDYDNDSDDEDDDDNEVFYDCKEMPS